MECPRRSLHCNTLDGWPSGLRRTPGTRVYVKAYRGFESHLLRHFLIFASPAPFLKSSTRRIIAPAMKGKDHSEPPTDCRASAQRQARQHEPTAMTREPPTAEQIAGMIGEIRRHGLGPAAIAREAGISRDIYRIEQGNSARPLTKPCASLRRCGIGYRRATITECSVLTKLHQSHPRCPQE